MDLFLFFFVLVHLPFWLAAPSYRRPPCGKRGVWSFYFFPVTFLFFSAIEPTFPCF